VLFFLTLSEQKYQELKAKLAEAIKEFAKEKGGISFYDLEVLLGEGEVYAALSKEPSIFVLPNPA
jgi:hypothetical protein